MSISLFFIHMLNSINSSTFKIYYTLYEEHHASLDHLTRFSSPIFSRFAPKAVLFSRYALSPNLLHLCLYKAIYFLNEATYILTLQILKQGIGL